MANYTEKIIYGFSNIHIAKYDDRTKTYDTPVPVLGGRSVEVSYDVQENKISAK